MTDQQIILQKLTRLDKKITLLANRSAKRTWVSVSVIKELTGWSGREELRRARNNSLVFFDKEKGYLLESLNPLFIKK